MNQPVIGILPALDVGYRIPEKKPTHLLFRDYTQMIASLGAVPLILNMDMPIGVILSLCDGIVISGGEDIEPDFYNETLLDVSGAVREPRERTEWERELIAGCDEVGMSLLGICYGMQLLNVHYGGTLYQDLGIEKPENIGHLKTIHNITFTNDFLGYKSGDVRPINSRHHQAVDVLGEGFQVTAVATDNVVEAITNGRHFGIQWHPESDETGAHIYRAFIERVAPGLTV